MFYPYSLYIISETTVTGLKYLKYNFNRKSVSGFPRVVLDFFRYKTEVWVDYIAHLFTTMKL